MGILHAIVIFWTLLHCATSDNEERISSLEEQVSILNRKVDELKSETITRNDVIRLLELNLAEITDDDSDDSTGFSESTNQTSGSTAIIKKEENKPDIVLPVTENKPNTVSPVTFIEIRRELQGSKVKFTVTYKPDVEEYAIIWQDHVLEQFPRVANYSDVPISNGLRETSILVAPLPADVEWYYHFVPFYGILVAPVSVRFRHPNGDGVFLMLRNAEEDAVEQDIPLPVLKLDPEGDLVYEDGEDAIFRVSTAAGAGEPFLGSVGRPTQMESYLRRPGTGELLYDGPIDEIQLELLGNRTFSDHQEWEFRMNTSDYKTSGIFVFVTSFYSSQETSLLAGSKCQKTLVLRPSTQEGAFPPGYLEFRRETWRIHDDEGTLRSVCRSNEKECDFTCKVLGTDITRLTAYKVEEDGSVMLVDDTIPEFNLIQGTVDDTFSREITVSYPSNLTKGTLRFRCVAENAAGRSVQQDVVMLYNEPSRVVSEESDIQILHMNDTLVELKIVCKVQGIPRPHVTFVLNTYAPYDHDIKPDELYVESENEVTAVKYFTYNPSDPHNSNSEYKAKLSSAVCQARTDSPYINYDAHRYQMPEQIID